MGLSPLLRQELDNLDKDADSRRAAMKALKSYARHLDSKSIPHFLAEVSDTTTAAGGAAGAGMPTGEFTISLYEVLARVHGRNIVPQIGNIMATIMRTLSSSGGSFPLHQACSKVVPAIARYGIDPSSTPDDEKAAIIASLCRPLCGALMGTIQQDGGAASGAALCLKALVESTNWRFASGEMVNEVCLKVAGAMHDRATGSNAHMGLAMALVKHNGLIAEAYARSIVRSGLQILDGDTAESSSQKRLSAIQMINFFMKFVDPRCLSSELGRVIAVMEKCQNDRMPFVRGAAFEASQSAKSIASQKGSRHEVGSIFSQEKGEEPVQEPLECQGQPCRLHRRCFSSPVQLCSNSNSYEDDLGEVCDSEVTDANFECTNTFAGFVSRSPNGSISRDKTPSPRASDRPISIDNVKIYSTPRKLLRLLQSSYDSDSASIVGQSTAKLSGLSSPDQEHEELVISSEQMQSLHSDSKADEMNDENETIDMQNSNDRTETLSNADESGLSTTEAENTSSKASPEIELKEDDVCITSSIVKTRKYRTKFTFVLSMIVIVLAIITMFIRIENYDDSVYLVPT
ncbi:unnamed protein product [Miscanthus lutarioriparius]|uniref:TORTIFOLIA1/SINE1-2 N-terminal domain-containing protein n=1 Tax=Miscanthus lutarioriparius TaxID=422564 RepID=A0A811QK77_9POAL|nr:unnamed protein product [Miscanthus lutarioriparius]